MPEKIDYDSFMASKGEQNKIPASSPGKPPAGPLPPPPPKHKKTNFNSPILIGLIIFFLIIGLFAAYSSYKPDAINDSEVQEKEIDLSKMGEIKVIHVDSNFSIYNEKVDAWADRAKGNIPFGTRVLTNADSSRNIFTINNVHTIRGYKNTKFVVESAEPLKDFKQKVLMAIEEGRIWVETAGDVFEIYTPRGVVKAEGGEVEVELENDGGVSIRSWKGDAKFVSRKKSLDPVEIKEKHMILVDTHDNIIPAPIEPQKNNWQKWNLATTAEEALTGVIKEFPGSLKVHPKLAGNKDKKPAGPGQMPPHNMQQPQGQLQQGQQQFQQFQPEQGQGQPPSPPSYVVTPQPGQRTGQQFGQQRPGFPSFGEEQEVPTYQGSGQQQGQYSQGQPPGQQGQQFGGEPPKPPSYVVTPGGPPGGVKSTPPPPPKSIAGEGEPPPFKGASSGQQKKAKINDDDDDDDDDDGDDEKKLENKPSMTGVPGMGIGDKPVGPSGGTGPR